MTAENNIVVQWRACLFRVAQANAQAHQALHSHYWFQVRLLSSANLLGSLGWHGMLKPFC
jgi:hypothetical protein